MVRVDPLSVSSLDDLRSQILSDMKGGELTTHWPQAVQSWHTIWTALP